jgi:hypothetical protein
MQRRAFMLLGAGSLFPLGCISKPQMELHHAQVTSAGPGGIGVDVFLRVNNDNSFDIQVRNVRVSTVVERRYQLPDVNYSPNQWLPADGSTIVRAPALIPWTIVGPLLAETAASTSLSYRVRGEADVTAIRSLGIQSNRYPVDETGTIPRSAVLQAARSAMPLPF